MKALYLHVGRLKTATTYLQGMFAANESILARSGILYPQAGLEHEAHHRLALDILAASDGVSNDVASLPVWNQLLREVESSDADSVLLSSEVFEWSVEPEQLEFLRHMFDVTIVMYVRAPEAFLESYYNQVVKDFDPSETRTIEEYCADRPALRFLDHFERVGRWADVFGKDRVRVGVFEEAISGGDVVRDFFALCGVRPIEFERGPSRIHMHKVSLEPDVLEYVRHLNMVGVTDVDAKFAMVVALADVTRPFADRLRTTRSGLLSVEFQRALRSRFEHSYNQLAQEYLGRWRSPYPPEDVVGHPEFELRAAEADAITLARVAALVHGFGIRV